MAIDQFIVDRAFGGRFEPKDGWLYATLDGGKCLTLNLTFGKDGIVVEGSQIGGWEDQGTVDGDISM